MTMSLNAALFLRIGYILVLSFFWAPDQLFLHCVVFCGWKLRILSSFFLLVLLLHVFSSSGFFGSITYVRAFLS